MLFAFFDERSKMEENKWGTTRTSALLTMSDKEVDGGKLVLDSGD